MSSTSPSGSPADPNSELPLGDPRIKRVHELVFGEIARQTARLNAACNALILDLDAFPTFLRESTAWHVMIIPRDDRKDCPVVVYLYPKFFRSLDHIKAFNAYINHLRERVIQFEEVKTCLGQYELHIKRPHFEIQVQCPVEPNHDLPADVDV
jgi:hypothetical protein